MCFHASERELSARQAVDWLNEQTRENVRFFGIELQVVRIGTSQPAPLFKLVAQPNDWQKQVRSGTRSGMAGTKSALCQQFWTRYLERMRDEHPDWSQARKAPNRNWMDFPSPIKGTRLNTSFAQGRRLRSEIYIDTGDKASNEAIFEHLLKNKDIFEAEYGRPMQWESLPNARASRIADYRPEADVTFEDQYDDFIAWLLDSGVRMRGQRRALAAVSQLTA